MFKVIPVYDDKYCACRIKLPSKIAAKRFDSIKQALHETYSYFRNEVREFECDPSVFIEYYARAYADALKSNEHRFDSMSLKIDGCEYLDGKDFIAINCKLKNDLRLPTTVILKVVETQEGDL